MGGRGGVLDEMVGSDKKRAALEGEVKKAAEEERRATLHAPATEEAGAGPVDFGAKRKSVAELEVTVQSISVHLETEKTKAFAAIDRSAHLQRVINVREEEIATLHRELQRSIDAVERGKKHAKDEVKHTQNHAQSEVRRRTE